MRNVWLPDPGVETAILRAVLDDPAHRDRNERYRQIMDLVGRDTDLVSLISLLDEPSAADVHLGVIDRIVALEKPAHDLFFGRMTLPYDGGFFENALRYFSRVLGRRAVEEAFLGFLGHNIIQAPADLAALLQVLGTNRNRANLELLYGSYWDFRETYPDKDYHEGPWLGMLYIES